MVQVVPLLPQPLDDHTHGHLDRVHRAVGLLGCEIAEDRDVARRDHRLDLIRRIDHLLSQLHD